MDNKYNVGDSVLLESKSRPSKNGNYEVTYFYHSESINRDHVTVSDSKPYHGYLYFLSGIDEPCAEGAISLLNDNA